MICLTTSTKREHQPPHQPPQISLQDRVQGKYLLLHLNFLLIRWENVCIVVSFLTQTQKKDNGFGIISANAASAPVLPMHILTRSETKTGSKVD